jgi:hypothetical protein
MLVQAAGVVPYPILIEPRRRREVIHFNKISKCRQVWRLCRKSEVPQPGWQCQNLPALQELAHSRFRLLIARRTPLKSMRSQGAAQHGSGLPQVFRMQLCVSTQRLLDIEIGSTMPSLENVQLPMRSRPAPNTSFFQLFSPVALHILGSMAAVG